MTIRYALFIDGAWIEGSGDTYSALVTVESEGLRIEIKPYNDAEVIDMVCLSFDELAAIVEMVARARDGKP